MAGKKGGSVRSRARGNSQKVVDPQDFSHLDKEPSQLKKVLRRSLVIARWFGQTVWVVMMAVPNLYGYLIRKFNSAKADVPDSSISAPRVNDLPLDEEAEEAEEADEEECADMTIAEANDGDAYRLMRIDSTCTSVCSEVVEGDGPLNRTLSLPLYASGDAAVQDADDILERSSSTPRALVMSADRSIEAESAGVLEIDYLQTFTNGSTVFHPILGPEGQQYYTDGTTIYAAACVLVKEPGKFIGNDSCPPDSSICGESIPESTESTHVSSEGLDSESVSD